MVENRRKLSFFTKFNFGIGQMAEGLKARSIGLLLLFYYQQVLGLPAWMGGLALFLALLFDAVTDPIAGFISDGWQSKWGRRHPFMYLSAFFLPLFFYLSFCPPDGAGTKLLFFWLMIFSILTNAAMTLYHVPHIALGAEITEDAQERTAIVGFRVFFGVGGSLLVAVSMSYFFLATDIYPDGRLNPVAYPPFALACSAAIFFTIFLSAIGTHNQIPFLPVPPQKPEKFRLLRVFQETREALKNISFRYLFIGVVIMNVMVGVEATLHFYMNLFFWEFKGNQINLLLAMGPVGTMMGTFFSRYFNQRFGKAQVLVIGTMGWAACQLVPVILRLTEVFFSNGTAALFYTMLSITFMAGFSISQTVISAGSLMADIADEYEYENNRRQEGIFFGAISFSGKASIGIGVFVAGFGLSLIGWETVKGLNPGEVAADIIFHLGVLYGPLVGFLAVIAVMFFSRIELTQSRHEEILKTLWQRRSSASSR